jgi:hypothetical protein
MKIILGRQQVLAIYNIKKKVLAIYVENDYLEH